MTLVLLLLLVLLALRVVRWLRNSGRLGEVKRLYRCGFSDKDIAKILHMSTARVSKIVSRIT
jgi:DNA-binding NarL/FixJ family response regulator